MRAVPAACLLLAVLGSSAMSQQMSLQATVTAKGVDLQVGGPPGQHVEVFATPYRDFDQPVQLGLRKLFPSHPAGLRHTWFEEPQPTLVQLDANGEGSTQLAIPGADLPPAKQYFVYAVGELGLESNVVRVAVDRQEDGLVRTIDSPFAGCFDGYLFYLLMTVVVLAAPLVLRPLLRRWLLRPTTWVLRFIPLLVITSFALVLSGALAGTRFDRPGPTTLRWRQNMDLRQVRIFGERDYRQDLLSMFGNWSVELLEATQQHVPEDATVAVLETDQTIGPLFRPFRYYLYPRHVVRALRNEPFAAILERRAELEDFDYLLTWSKDLEEADWKPYFELIASPAGDTYLWRPRSTSGEVGDE
jgi:hypothetical protein